MRNKILTFILAILAVAFVFTAPAKAETTYIFDEANVLTKTQASNVQKKLSEYSKEVGFDIVIVTVDAYEGESIEEYAHHYYNNIFQSEANGNGIILMLSMAERDWTMQTFGTGEDMFIDEGLIYLENEVITFVSRGYYYDAFNKFGDECSEIVTFYTEKGKAFGSPSFNIKRNFILAVIIGCVISYFVLSRMKAQLKTVAPRHTAEMYVRENSLNITRANDFFLYRTFTRVPKPKNNSSSSGRSGGSRSSGSGRSGKF